MLEKKTGGFEIVHYQLSIAVPHEVQPRITEAIKAYEGSQRAGELVK